LTDGKQKAFRPHWRSIFSFVFKEQSGHPPSSGHADPPQFRATSATGFWGRMSTLSETLQNVNPKSRDFHSTIIAAKWSFLHFDVMINQLLLGSADYRETQH
jgi:hypothetical protein